MTNQFIFTSKAKTYSLASILVGIVLMGLGYFIHKNDPMIMGRIWGNLLICSYYFVGLGMGGLFFYAVQYTAKSGWSAILVRLPSAFGTVLPVACILLLIVIAGGIATHHLYQSWAVPGLTDPNSPLFDKLIKHKSVLLNVPTFLGLLVFFFLGWTFFSYRLRALSKQEEIEGNSRPLYKKTFSTATFFIGFFALTSAAFAFMVMMSNDAKEFSTMFAWYNFAGIWVSSLATITLVLIYLKEQGYFPEVNENHLQNLGSLMLAFTIFFTYTWFFQLMLTWYSNLPEEIFYVTNRWRSDWGYKWIYWINIVICFVIPFFTLLTSDAKRNFKVMKIISIVIILGHWLDWFIQVMPGTVQGHWAIDLPELGAFLLFAGLFSYTMFYGLTKMSLENKNHVFFEESLHHHIENV